MGKLDSSPRLRALLLDASNAQGIVNWWTSLGTPEDEGACIPIAVFTSAYLVEAGIDARPVEAGARFDDPLSLRYAEIATNTSERALEARDERGLDFLGHLVVHLPTKRAVADLSLPGQPSKVLRSIGAPDILVGEVDHTRGQVGFRVGVGRGNATYRIYPRRDGWRRRRWPWRSIEKLGQDAARHRPPFDDLPPVETRER